MVVFTCNYCGESLQKPRVEKHYSFTCRREKFLTCVDCFKDFRGDEYNVHTKCVTEEERYSGKDFIQKTKKGEVKQESWMEMIKSIILHENNLSPDYKKILTTISYYNNVPRKKAKFINFIRSSSGGRITTNDIEGIWNIIEKYKSQNILSTGNNDNKISTNEETNGHNSLEKNASKSKNKNKNIPDEENNENRNTSIKEDNGCQVAKENSLKSKEKKRKRSIKEETENNNFEDSPKKKKCESAIAPNKIEAEIVTGNEDSQADENEMQSFSFSDHILQILTERKSIMRKKLNKKILKVYTKSTGETIMQEKLEKKINKKLRKMNNVAIINECVKLIET